MGEKDVTRVTIRDVPKKMSTEIVVRWLEDNPGWELASRPCLVVSDDGNALTFTAKRSVQGPHAGRPSRLIGRREWS